MSSSVTLSPVGILTDSIVLKGILTFFNWRPSGKLKMPDWARSSRSMPAIVVSEESVCSGDLVFELAADFDGSSSAQIEGEFGVFRADQEGIAVGGEGEGEHFLGQAVVKIIKAKRKVGSKKGFFSKRTWPDSASRRARLILLPYSAQEMQTTVRPSGRVRSGGSRGGRQARERR